MIRDIGQRDHEKRRKSGTVRGRGNTRKAGVRGGGGAKKKGKKKSFFFLPSPTHPPPAWPFPAS